MPTSMGLLDGPNASEPRCWSDFSFDFQLFYVYFGVMAALFMFGSSFTVKQEIAAAAILTSILSALSLRIRRNMNWRWPGASPKQWLVAVSVFAVSVVFDFAADPFAPRSDPTFLPWHLAGLGIAAFGVLAALRVVETSKTAFLRACGRSGLPASHPEPEFETTSSSPPAEPVWEGAVRGMYYMFATLVWVGFLGWFYEFGTAFQNGSVRPVVGKTAPIYSHGAVRYVPNSQKVLLDWLDKVGSIGIPAVIALGFLLHFFLSVKMFPNIPTYKEWRKRRAIG